ncbi:MAG: YtxH domain-containing protein [Candidatus Azobacteroides sp.]|nr:YtxH domain-containing protein [Candidatus Azobacteroides sp.]
MKTNALFAFLAGAAAGAVFALLYAPDKGEKTRQKLADKIKEGADYGSESVNEMIGKIQEKAKEGIEKVKESIDKVSQEAAK